MKRWPGESRIRFKARPVLMVSAAMVKYQSATQTVKSGRRNRAERKGLGVRRGSVIVTGKFSVGQTAQYCTDSRRLIIQS